MIMLILNSGVVINIGGNGKINYMTWSRTAEELTFYRNVKVDNTYGVQSNIIILMEQVM